MSRRNWKIQRKDDLVALGFKSYEQYLNSELWARIRSAQLERSPNCRRCKKTATQVHHGSYKYSILSGDDPGKLFSVCRDCHRKAHGVRKGGKPRFNHKSATRWLTNHGRRSKGKSLKLRRKNQRAKARKRKLHPSITKGSDPTQRKRDEARLAAIKKGRGTFGGNSSPFQP